MKTDKHAKAKVILNGTRRGVAAKLLGGAVLFLLLFSACVKGKGPGSDVVVDQTAKPGTGAKTADVEEPDGPKVKVDIYGMSKCPYFARLIATIRPMMEEFEDYLDLSIDYVARIEDGEAVSMHGPAEVAGDLLQLCAQKHASQTQTVDFILCQSQDIKTLPQNWEKCAQGARIDPALIENCYKSITGRQLLVKSINRAMERKVASSPVIYVNGEHYQRPHSPPALAHAICDTYGDLKPRACAKYPPAAEIPITVISDKRCTIPDCHPKLLEKYLASNFESVDMTMLDYSDDVGRALFQKSGFKYLPVAIFDENLKKDEWAFGRIEAYLTEMGDDRFAYPIGRYWDPTLEICDDQIDNTGNGKVDCDDPHCATQSICRDEVAGSMKLFIMSHCPYCAVVLGLMKNVLNLFENSREEMDFKIEFVGSADDNELRSMHGEAELQEDLRQVCAQKHYAKEYKFMEYIWCRNEAFKKNRGQEQADEWKTCAQNGIKASVIEKCATGRQGKKLLTKSFELANDVDVFGSPIWLINNRFKTNARSVPQILGAFCHKNSATSGCEKLRQAAAKSNPQSDPK